MDCSYREWRTISSRVEDLLPNVPEKSAFEKHMSAYFERIRRCNVYYSTLITMKKYKDEFHIAGEYAPAFWTNVRYGFQMGLVTEVVAFLGNDTESLPKYYQKVLQNKDRIFTRRFFHTLRETTTGEEHEEEWHNRHSNEDAFRICQKKLDDCKPHLDLLKSARDKVYCHLDKKSLSIEDCNRDIFSHITDETIRKILDNIGYVIQTLMALYDNVSHAVKYSNQDDVYGILHVCKTYSDFLPEIQKAQKLKIDKEIEELFSPKEKSEGAQPITQ